MVIKSQLACSVRLQTVSEGTHETDREPQKKCLNERAEIVYGMASYAECLTT